MKINQTNAMLSRHTSLPPGKGLLSKKLLAFLFVALSTMFFSSEIFAQSGSETVYKDWLRVGESSSHVDVSARIVKCSATSPNEVQMHIFNEGSESSSISFVVTVVNNDTNESFNTTISHSVSKATMVKATCDNDETLNGLKFALPASYNPSNIIISVTFN